MHVNVNGGHTPTAPGASHYIDELTEDRAVKDAVKAELSRRGHTVSDSTSPDWCNQNQDLAYQATKVNSSGCDLAISIHFNASSVTGGTRGVEAYYYGGDDTGHDVAARMSANVAALLGLPDRGAKDGSHLYFTRMTNPTAVLIEVCFVDAEGDADAYNPTPYAEIARAIADGIEGTTSESEDDMELNDKITDGYIMGGSTYPTVGNCLYWSAEYGWQTRNGVNEIKTQLAALSAAVEALAKAQGADPEQIAKVVADAVAEKLEKIELSVEVSDE